jgi:hypothetical protein
MEVCVDPAPHFWGHGTLARMSVTEDWIAARGPLPLDGDPAGVPIPEPVLSDPNLSLMAKGLFARLLAEPGTPVNPYDDAYETEDDIANAIEELIDANLIMRVTR